MNSAVHAPAFAHLIDEGIANRIQARRHLDAMDPAKRAALEAEWLAAEHHREPVSAEIKARAAKEWSE